MSTTPDAAPEPVAGPSNFVREIIEADRAAGKHGGRVVTRFPPEPNGYSTSLSAATCPTARRSR